MTKKDYILIAKALTHFYQFGNSYDDRTTIAIIEAISKALKQDNPKFNPVRFLDYIRQ